MEHGPKSQDPGTWAWTARRRHGPPASALPLKPRLNHIKSWRLSGCSGLTRLGWRPPFQTLDAGTQEANTRQKQGIPYHVQQPHTGYRTHDECREPMACPGRYLLLWDRLVQLQAETGLRRLSTTTAARLLNRESRVRSPETGERGPALN
jgi:hypothetical protein